MRTQTQPPPRTDSNSGAGQATTDDLLFAAGAAMARGRDREGDRLVAMAVVRSDCGQAAARVVKKAVAGVLFDGWNVDLLSHVVRRRGTPALARLVLDAEHAVIADARLAVAVLGHLLVLPPLEPLREPTATGGADEKILARVRALLAKAESTTFPDEAAALTAKAQELMARHALDNALVGGDDDDVGGFRIAIEDPYADAKATLLHVIATANRCRAVYSSDVGLATVLGFPGDLRTTELLFTSLLVQATNAMTKAGTSRDQRLPRFRSSFLTAFAERVGERLRESTERQTAEVDEESGGSLLPVLVARSDRVDDAVRDLFPKMVKRGGRVSDWSGYAAGLVAGDQADLSAGPRLRAG